jgi:acyl-coenzyme A thioesterase PaaI-like protein
MNVLKLPFNKIMLIKKSVRPAAIFMLEDDAKYQNHLGTVHASAQYALAEATSGEVLERNFGDWKGAYFPVVRTAEVKYRNPAKGSLFSTGFIDPQRAAKAKKELSERGRTLVEVIVNIADEGGNITFEGRFKWFIAKTREEKTKV